MTLLTPSQKNRLEAALWPTGAETVVAVLDGAINPELIDRLYAAPLRFESLMGGYLTPDLAEVSPYAVALQRGSAFADWVLTGAWGQHWGILARSVDGFDAAARRFRALFIVQGADQRPRYFRFYDPRALRTVLPVCTPAQRQEIFSGLLDLWLEGSEPASVRICRLQADTVDERTLELGD